MKFDKLTKIIVFGAAGLILIIALLLWRFGPQIRNLFSRAEVGTIDLSWGNEDQITPVHFVCTTDTNNHRSVDILATLTNYGPETAQNITVKLHGFLYDRANPVTGTPGIPSWLDVDVGGVGTFNGDTWTVGSLTDQQSADLRITGQIPDDKIFNLTGEVDSASPDDSDSTPGNWENTDEDDKFGFGCLESEQPPPPPPPPSPTPEADLSLTKNVDRAGIEVNSNATFTIEVKNDGPEPTTNVTVKDVLPGGLDIVSATPTRGTYAQANGIWTIGNMAVGDTVSIALLITATSPGSFTNTAEVASSDVHDPDSRPNNNVASEDDQDSVAITVTNPPPPPPGEVSCDPSTQTVQVNHDVAVHAAGGSGTFAWSAPGGMPDSGSGDSFTTQYAAAGTKTITVTSGAKQDTCEVLVIDVPPPSGPEADLSLTKTAGNPTPQLNGNFTYSIVLSNAGPDAATNVAVKDVLPSGVKFVDAAPTQGTSYDSATGVWTIGTVAAGANASLIITVTAMEVGAITNTAEVTASDQPDPDSTPNNQVAGEDDQADAAVTVETSGGEPEADLSLTKVVSNSEPKVNNSVTYVVTLSNSGPDQATGVTVKDLLPTGVTYTSHTAEQGTYDNTTGVWTAGVLDKDESVTLEIVVKVVQEGTIVNVAEVTASDQPDPDSTPNNQVAGEDDQASASLAASPVCTSNCGGGPSTADLSLTKVVSDSQPRPGQNIIYNIMVFNSGPLDATGIVVGDLLPDGLSYVSHTTEQGTYDSDSGVWTVGSLANGANAKLTIKAQTDKLGSIINTGEVTDANQTDPDSTPNNHDASEDDQASATINVRSGGGGCGSGCGHGPPPPGTPPTFADLSLTKVVNEPKPVVGQHITYTITLINSGPAAATGVSVKDTIPPQLMFDSFNATQGSYDSASGVWNVGLIAPGNSASLQLSAAVKTEDNISNISEVFFSDQPDPDSTPNNNDISEDDQAIVIVRSRPPKILPAAGTSSAAPIALGLMAIFAGAVIRFRFRSSAKQRVRSGGVIVQSFQRYD